MTKKILAIVFSVIFIGAFVFFATWTFINWDKVKASMDGTKLYTYDDIEKATQDGYNTALVDKEEYEKLINSYKDTITIKTDEISHLNVQINDLNADIINKKTKISNLESAIEIKNSLITDLENSLSSKDEDINTKLELIEELNDEIIQLNIEIDELEKVIITHESTISNLNTKIDNLNKSIAYYENFIKGLETSSQAVATFMYNDSVYSILLLQKGSKISINNPADTEYIDFLGWTIDGEIIDLNTYTLNVNTTFYAVLNYSYDVNFMVDDEVFNTQIIAENGVATLPTIPTKTGYEFVGWTLDGETVIDVTTNKITANTTYIAKFVKLHTAVFKIGNDVVSTQIIKNNEYVTNVDDIISNYQDTLVVNYWTINGVQVDLSTYAVTSDVVIEANVTYYRNVKFMYEDTEFYSTKVLTGDVANITSSPNNTTRKEFLGWSLDKSTIVDVSTIVITEDTEFYAVIKYYAIAEFYVDNTLHETHTAVIGSPLGLNIIPTKTGYDFDGWTINGTDIVDVNSYIPTESTTYTFNAVFTKLHTVSFQLGNDILNTQTIRHNSCAENYSVNSTDRVQFNGWTINGKDIVDVSTHVITGNTTFIASVTYKYKVEFEVGGKVTYTYFVVENTTLDTVPTTSGSNDWSLNYWTLDGSNSYDVANHVVTEDIKFIAKATRTKVSIKYTKTDSHLYEQNGFNFIYEMDNVEAFNKGNFNSYNYTGYIWIGNQSYAVSGNTSGYNPITCGSYTCDLSSTYYDRICVTWSSSIPTDFTLDLVLTPVYGIQGL